MQGIKEGKNRKQSQRTKTEHQVKEPMQREKKGNQAREPKKRNEDKRGNQ